MKQWGKLEPEIIKRDLWPKQNYQIIHTHTNGRCLHAMQPKCTCKCCGANHGILGAKKGMKPLEEFEPTPQDMRDLAEAELYQEYQTSMRGF